MLVKTRVLGSFAGAIAALVFSCAFAATAPVVKAQKIRDFARISFEWPKETRLSAGTQGNQLRVTFEQAADVNPAPILKNLSPFITNVQKGSDGRTLIFSMNQAYKIRSFVSSNVNGVDILRVSEQSPAPNRQSPEKKRDEKKEEGPSVANTPIPNDKSKLPFQTVNAAPPAPKAVEAKPKPQTKNPALVFAAAPRPLLKPEQRAVKKEESKSEPQKEPNEEKTAEVAEKPAVSEPQETVPPTSESTKTAAVTKSEKPEKEAPAAKPVQNVETGPDAPSVDAPTEEIAADAKQESQPALELKPEIRDKLESVAQVAEKPAEGEVMPPAMPEVELPSNTPEETPEASEQSPISLTATEVVQDAAPVMEDAIASDAPKAETEASKPAMPEIPEAPSAAPAAAKLDEATAKATQANSSLSAPLMPPAEVAQSALALTAETKDGKTYIHFPWTQRVAVTAFRRGNRDYLYFSKPVTIDTSALQILQDVVDVSAAPLDKGTLVTFQTPRKGLMLDKALNEYTWHVQLTDVSLPPLHPVRSAPQTEPPLKPHVMMPVLEITDPVTYDDPVTGDQLTLVPSYRAGDGVFPSREFVEFELLPTAQGVVVRPKAENLRVARLRNGMKITSPQGLMLSKDLPSLAQSDLLTSIEGDTLFPYEGWKTPADKNFFDFINRLQAEIPFAPAMQKNAYRLRLAQLYLAEERPQDAIALIELIEREAPEFYVQNKLNALRGAADFLTYRYQEAYARFADGNLDGIPEIELWRDTMNVLLTGDGKGNFSDYNRNFISKYPPYMAVRLGFVAADLLIGRGQYNKALKIFDSLARAKIEGEQRDYVDYQVGRVSAGTNQKKMAKAIWEKLAESSNNFIRARASFALTNMLLRDAEIDIPQTLARLEPLRIVWRGDDFELGLLQFIGDLYEANNQPREALRAYREIIQFFPNNPGNQDLLAKMADMFVTLFNGGAADKLTPLEALALYYEFRDLTPLEAEGDKMIRNLADRLVQVDLLDRAAALLEHQIRFRLSGEERSRVGAQLALIYLLNHQPKQALSALEITGYGQNPDDLQHQRILLTARALADLKEPKRALNLLEDDDSPEASQLRLGIYWDEKDWKNVIATAEAMMGRRKDPAAPITAEEGMTVMRLALAYVFERQKEQVQYLRDYFLPLMKGNPEENLFNFITQDAPVDYRNLAQLTSHLNNMENFLATYRTKMQKEGLSKVIP